MAQPNPPKVYRDFIGPEGSRLANVRTGGNTESIGGDSRSLSDADLQRQLSIAQEIDAQRGLTPGEKESFFELQQELEARQQRKAGVEQGEIERLLGGGGEGVGGGEAVPGLAEYISEIQSGGDRERALTDESFAKALEMGQENVNRDFGQQRARAIDEQAALGFQRNQFAPGGAIGNIDTARQNTLGQLIQSLGAAKAQTRSALETDILGRTARAKEFGVNAGLQNKQMGLNQAIQRAQLGLNARQFGSQLGLEKEKLGETKRQTSLSDLRRQEENSLAERLGKAKAKSQEPGVLDYLNTGANIAGNIAKFVA